MRRAFFYDQSRCMACNACTVACKDWNQVNPGPVRYRSMYTHEVGTGKNTKFFPLSMACNHCEDPACVNACSIKAITKRDDGVVIVDRNKCTGLKLCISACPYAVPKISNDKQEPDKKEAWVIAHPMQKCDFCRSRVDNGEQPVCVSACAARALDSGDYDALMRKYPDAVPMTETAFPYAYVNTGVEDTTGPMFLVRKRKTQTII